MTNIYILLSCLLSISVILSQSDSDRTGVEGPVVPERSVPDNFHPQDNSVLQRTISSDVFARPYDSDKSGPVQASDDLTCHFDKDVPCCWHNEKPPIDTMEWALTEGDFEASKTQQAFGSSTGPMGSYLTVATNNPASQTDTAQLSSCPIVCTNEPIKVTTRHWITRQANLQVCTRPAEAITRPLQNCVNIDPKSTQSTIEVPPGSNFMIVFVARDFVAADSAAVLDEIKVDFVPCPPSTIPPPTTMPLPPPPPPTTSEAPVPITATAVSSLVECEKIECTFEKGNPCAYSDNSYYGAYKTTKQYSVAKGRFKNPQTGVRQAAGGDYYAASYMYPKDNTILETRVDMLEDRIIKFDYYKATQDVTFDVCCDSIESCVYKAGHNAKKTDYKVWHKGIIRCPKGTQKLIFYSQNDGVNEGAVGLDNIQLFSAENNPICEGALFQVIKRRGNRKGTQKRKQFQK